MQGAACMSSCVLTLANTSLGPGSPPLTSPITGTIVRWRLLTSNASVGSVKLRVLRPSGGGSSREWARAALNHRP
jgi:hypothetical protein